MITYLAYVGLILAVCGGAAFAIGAAVLWLRAFCEAVADRDLVAGAFFGGFGAFVLGLVIVNLISKFGGGP